MGCQEGDGEAKGGGYDEEGAAVADCKGRGEARCCGGGGEGGEPRCKAGFRGGVEGAVEEGGPEEHGWEMAELGLWSDEV